MVRIILDTNLYPESKIVSNFDRVLFSAFSRAYDRGNKVAWQEIFSFILKQLTIALRKDSIEVVNQLIYLPTHLYNSISKNEDNAYDIIDQTTIYFKSISFIFKKDASSIDGLHISPNMLHKFYEGVITFFHYVILIDNSDVLKRALNELSQMSDRKYDGSTRLRIEESIRQTGNNEEAKIIKLHADTQSVYSITHRRVTFSLKSWAVYLYALDEIGEERLLMLDNNINISYPFFEDILDDVIFIRNMGGVNYLGLSGWDYKERSSGKVYSPPDVSDWIIYGLCFYLLKGSLPHFKLEVIFDDADHLFLYDTVKTHLDYFRKNVTKWQKALGLAGESEQVEEAFEQRSRQILNIFEQLKIRHDAQRNTEIVSENLDDELVTEFKEKLAEAWQKQCSVYALFDYYSNKNIHEKSDELPYLGANILLQRFKIMFVEKNYQQIYGSSDLGADIGRRTDGTFISKIIRRDLDCKNYTDIIEGIDESISVLAKNKYETNIVIIPPEFSYKTNLMQSKDFVRKTDMDIGSLGQYKGIPVVTFYSRELSNQVIVAQFEKAFSLDIYENEDLFYGRLHILIRQLTTEEVDHEFEKNKSDWKTDEKGFKLTEEQAKMRIGTSVYLELWSRGRFNIIDEKAYKIFTVSPPAV